MFWIPGFREQQCCVDVGMVYRSILGFGVWGQPSVQEHKLVLDANWRWIHTTEGQLEQHKCFDL